MGIVRMKEPSKEMLEIASRSASGQGRSSIGMESSVGEYFYINLNKLIPFKNQARKVFNEEELEQLALSIIEHGIRQPITVVRSQSNSEHFEIVSGERRARAAKMAGLDSVPCIIIPDYSKAEAVAVVENLHRSDLHPVELAKAYDSLLKNSNFSSGAEVAASLGISKSSFYEVIQILKLPESVQQDLLKHEIKSRDQIRKLLKSDDPQKSLNKMIAPATRLGYSRSILRVGLEHGEFSVQKDAIAKLKAVDKEKLKQLLSSILDQL